MWTVNTSCGELTHDGQHIGKGYSGHGPGKNNPALQQCPGVGPIPCGFYTVLPPVDNTHLGPVAMHLDPEPLQPMFGRSGFWIHGDSIKHPGEGSHGCICLPRQARYLIADTTDRRLQVIDTPAPATT